MSTYEDQMDSNNVICPYCESEYQPESESYDESPSVEKCDDCGKKYTVYQSFSVDHHAEPDCELNGESHDWESHNLSNGKTHDFCSVCGIIRPFREQTK